MKKVIALTTAIISQIYYICKIYLSKDKKRKLIGLIATLQILSPQQIIRKVNSHRGTALDICRGKIFAGEPCYSVLDPSLKVAYSKLFEGRFKGLAPKN